MLYSAPVSARQASRERYLAKLDRITPAGDKALIGLAALEQERVVLAAGVLSLAADFAEAHPAVGLDDFEAALDLAGPGAPVVAEYAVAVLSASLSMTDFATRKLLGDAIELKHRLPLLWGLIQEFRVPAWKVRGVCDLTQGLGVEACGWVDEQLAAVPDRVNLCRIERLAATACALFDPEALAEAEAEGALGRGVFVHHPGSRCGAPVASVSRVEVVLDTPDAVAFEEMVKALAQSLADQGCTDGLDVRRARAVGLLADPQAALGVLAGAGMPARVETPLSLVVHFDPSSVEDSQSLVGVDERLGVISSDLVRRWTGSARVTVRPVLHLGREIETDAHDPNDNLREQVIQRNAVCVFPGCNRDSRRCDLDHVTPYLPIDQGGGPGQTRSSNLAPLCRFHHRVKTHAGWRYRLLEDGTTIWRGPGQATYRKPTITRRP